MSGIITRYFNWEGDACRVMEDMTTGDRSADIYRAGHGHLEVDVTDVLYGAVEIGEKEFKSLVLLAIEHAKADSEYGNA